MMATRTHVPYEPCATQRASNAMVVIFILHIFVVLLVLRAGSLATVHIQAFDVKHVVALATCVLFVLAVVQVLMTDAAQDDILGSHL